MEHTGSAATSTHRSISAKPARSVGGSSLPICQNGTCLVYCRAGNWQVWRERWQKVAGRVKRPLGYTGPSLAGAPSDAPISGGGRPKAQRIHQRMLFKKGGMEPHANGWERNPAKTARTTPNTSGTLREISKRFWWYGGGYCALREGETDASLFG